MKLYDLAVIGAGPAGISAAKTASDKDLSVLILERGKDLIKRRDPTSGWFGEGLFNIDRFESKDCLLHNTRATNEIFTIIKKLTNEKIDKNNKFYQLPSQFGTTLASYFFEKLNHKADILFNSEVLKVEQNEQGFLVHTVKNVFQCRRCLITTGKYSIEWIKNLCATLKIELSENKTKIGVRVEVPTFRVKNFINKGDIEIQNVYDTRFNSFVGEWEEINILSAFGYSIPNEKSCKTNFMVGTEISAEIDEIIRETKIINILANDRIKCERVFDYMEEKSVLRHIKNFNSLRTTFEKLETLLPSFINYAIMYVPEIRLNGILPVNANMATAIPGLYGAGECTSKVSNLIGAMASGIIVAKTIIKER